MVRSAQQLVHWSSFQERGDLKVVWTEDLVSPKRAAHTMAEVAEFLGLERFDFSDAVQERFNTHERPGYETPTKAAAAAAAAAAAGPAAAANAGSPQWLREYFAPRNQALATQIGHGCSWATSTSPSTTGNSSGEDVHAAVN